MCLKRRLQVAPAVYVEHHPVCRRRRIEPHLRPGSSQRVSGAGVVNADGDHGLTDDEEVGPSPPRRRHSFRDGGQRVIAEGALGAERVHEQPVCCLRGHPEHAGPDCPDHDRRWRHR